MEKFSTNEGKGLLQPKIDVVFHALFREENKDLTEALISDILQERVKVLTTDKNRYINIKETDEKFGIMDLRAELEGGTQCNIEIQLEQQKNENERFLYYWADAYTRQLKKGDLYKELNKTISIIIVDHEIAELKGIEKLGTKWQIRDNETGKQILTNRLEIVIIEMPKARRIYKQDIKNKIGQWMMFFENPNTREVKEIMVSNEDIRKAVEELNGMSEDNELRRRAELRVKALRDEQAALEYAIEKGLKQGIEQGIEQGKKKKQIEIAKNMLNEDMDIELIEKITGLTKA